MCSQEEEDLCDVLRDAGDLLIHLAEMNDAIPRALRDLGDRRHLLCLRSVCIDYRPTLLEKSSKRYVYASVSLDNPIPFQGYLSPFIKP